MAYDVGPQGYLARNPDAPIDPVGGWGAYGIGPLGGQYGGLLGRPQQSGGGGAGSGGGGDPLAAQRALVDDRFAQLYGLQNPMATGQDPVFSQSARQGLLAQASDAGQGQFRSNERMLRQGFRSNMGAAGGLQSGGEMQAVMDARRRAAQDTWARRSGLETTFETENRAGRERGIQSMLATLGLEVPWRSRFEVTGQDPLASAYAQMLGGGGGFGRFATNPSGGGKQEEAPQQPADPTGGWGFTPNLVSKTVNSSGTGPFAYTSGQTQTQLPQFAQQQKQPGYNYGF